MKRLAEVAVVAILYIGTAKLGFFLAIPPGNVTVVWPPSGIALAAVLLLGTRVWPGIWLGSVVANIWFFAGITNPFSVAALATSLSIGAGSSLQALLGALLIRLFVGARSPFDRPQDVFSFAVIEMLSCVVAAAFGVTSLCLGGYGHWASYAHTWLTWYTGDLVGVIVVTPSLLIWRERSVARWGPARVVEAILFVAVFSMVTRIVFGTPVRAGPIHYPGGYALIPLVVWAAVRFGRRGVMMTVLVVSAVAIWGTIQMFGPFAGEPSSESLLPLQVYVGIVALTGLVLATAITEFTRSEHALRNAHDELEQRVHKRTIELHASEAALQEREALLHGLVEHAPDSIVVVDAQGRIVRANAQTEAMFGYHRDELLGEPVEMLLPERFRERHSGHRTGYGHEPRLRPMGAGLELYGRRKDGSEFPVDIMLSPMQPATGGMVIAIVRDITRRKQAEEQLQQSQQQLRALNTRLQEVREEERTRIARELHDELGQAMTGLKMELSWVSKHLVTPGESLPPAIGDKLTEMTNLINGTIHSVRRISSELRPGLLDDLGLAAAIEWQAHDFESRSGIACEVTVPANGVNLDRETSTAVFRIFQETLTNVARHANATKVKVSMSQERRRVVLEVKDNGRGITASALSNRSSLGLLGMRERAALFGGEVNFVGVAGQGTTVAVTIPQPQTG